MIDKMFAEKFQEAVFSPEWHSAYIVYEKYKRKYNLNHENLKELRDYLADYAIQRKKENKKISQDILIQEASRVINKRNG